MEVIFILVNPYIQCQYCEKYGHFEFECRKKKKILTSIGLILLKKMKTNFIEENEETNAMFSTYNMVEELLGNFRHLL
jgi:hypothetical protein